ncbi:MAG: arylsulfatase [Verrucomicrobiota bacterium]
MINIRILTGFALFFAASLAAAAPPNIVLVITDDQGYGDIAAHGHPFLRTPHLDKLHGESVRLDDYHVAPTCAPTRAALLTGHWTNRTGVWHTIMGRSMIRENEVTAGQIFGDAGYATGMFGKWHLGDNYPYRPEDRGFQEVIRHAGGGAGQTPDYWDNSYFDDTYFHNGKPTKTEGHCTDVWFEYAKKFIKKSSEAGKPFFAYICTNAPHSPMHSPQEWADLYLDKVSTGIGGKGEKGEAGDPNNETAHYFGMISHIDDNVGRLRDFLEEHDLSENTIFIFTTDNGTVKKNVFDGGMRGGKGSEFDGGHRVPFFTYWPKGGLTGGRQIDTITSYVDIVPTLIDLCGIDPPEGVKFDGTSIRPLLEKGDGAPWTDRILVTDSQRVRDPIKWRKSAVMTERWRLINGEALFDIEADPMQVTNIARDHPETVKRLRAFYEEWWAELEPTFALTTEIYLGHPDANPVHLTSHDWIADELTPWNQAHIREGVDLPGHTGFWAVKVIEGGRYEIELRRWPRSANQAITAALAPGEAVPGSPAFRTTPGRAIPVDTAHIEIDGRKLSKAIPKGAKSVTFKLDLEPGQDEFWAMFTGPNDYKIGAFYAYVKKL